jgi:hypothetical protein
MQRAKSTGTYRGNFTVDFSIFLLERTYIFIDNNDKESPIFLHAEII